MEYAIIGIVLFGSAVTVLRWGLEGGSLLENLRIVFALIGVVLGIIVGFGLAVYGVCKMLN